VKRLALVCLFACGDNTHIGPLVYQPTRKVGALNLLPDPASTGSKMIFDLVVGDHPLTGFSTGFDLPIDATKVTIGAFTPGTALDPGTPPAAGAAIGSSGELANQLVVALSQKATTTPTDTMLPPGTQLLQIELDVVEPHVPGLVFEGSNMTSAGLRDRSGTTVVDTPDVVTGSLVVVP
jgi:hypothetical protein